MKAILATIALLTACGGGRSTQIREVVLPSGGHGFSVTCGRRLGDCMNAAGTRCPGGYTILYGDKTDGYEARAFANQQIAIARADKTTDREMIVECKGAPAPCPPISRECVSLSSIALHCEDERARRAELGCSED